MSRERERRRLALVRRENESRQIFPDTFIFSSKEGSNMRAHTRRHTHIDNAMTQSPRAAVIKTGEKKKEDLCSQQKTASHFAPAGKERKESINPSLLQPRSVRANIYLSVCVGEKERKKEGKKDGFSLFCVFLPLASLTLITALLRERKGCEQKARAVFKTAAHNSALLPSFLSPFREGGKKGRKWPKVEIELYFALFLRPM